MISPHRALSERSKHQQIAPRHRAHLPLKRLCLSGIGLGGRGTDAAGQDTAPTLATELRATRGIDPREATMDAHDECEQRMGFATMIADSLALPFETEVLGIPVSVKG